MCRCTMLEYLLACVTARATNEATIKKGRRWSSCWLENHYACGRGRKVKSKVRESGTYKGDRQGHRQLQWKSATCTRGAVVQTWV